MIRIGTPYEGAGRAKRPLPVGRGRIKLIARGWRLDGTAGGFARGYVVLQPLLAFSSGDIKPSEDSGEALPGRKVPQGARGV